MSDDEITCPETPEYNELAARETVWRRNHRDGGLFWAAEWCPGRGSGDHWHVYRKTSADA